MAGGEPPTPPAAPSGLTAEATGYDRVALRWSDNADNEAAFVIERDGAEVQTVGSNATSALDTGLAGSTTYSYRVKARNSAGDSAWTDIAQATTDQTPPSSRSRWEVKRPLREHAVGQLHQHLCCRWIR